jgi:hypothetical protein
VSVMILRMDCRSSRMKRSAVCDAPRRRRVTAPHDQRCETPINRGASNGSEF